MFAVPMSDVDVACASPKARRRLRAVGLHDATAPLRFHAVVELPSAQAAHLAAAHVKSGIGAGTFAPKLAGALPAAAKARVHKVAIRWVEARQGGEAGVGGPSPALLWAGIRGVQGIRGVAGASGDLSMVSTIIPTSLAIYSHYSPISLARDSLWTGCSWASADSGVHAKRRTVD